MSRIQHETELEKLTAIAQKLSSISLQHSAATVTTFSKDPADNQNHIAVLQAETTRVNKTVEDPLLRFGFAVGSQRAVHHIGKEIGITDHINHAYEKRLTHIPSDTFKPEEGKKVSDVKLLTKRTLRQWNTNTDYFFGTIQTCSTTKQLHSNMSGIEEVDDEDSLYEHKSSLVIRPAAWLVSLGFNSGLRLGLFNSSVRGWQSSLNTFCAVPDDSSIFELSRDGNLSAIRGLFSKGLASVRDTNSHGKTPLYVAAESHHPELCKFLIAAGADKSVRSGDNWIWGKKHSPVLAACYAETKEVPFSTTIDTLRLFTDEMDFVEADGDGWLALSGIADLYCRWEPDIFRISDLLVWVLQLFSPEIRTHLIESSYARILRVILNGGMVARLLLELGPVGAIDAVHVEEGFTALQWTLVWATSHTYCLESELEMILAFDADIHHLGFEPEYSFREETPLSLALYSSWLFRRFTNVLKKRQIDMDEFVLQELREHSPLLNDGWTGQTLRALFEHELESDDEYTDVDFCDECHWVLLSSPGLQVEIAWQYYLEWLKGWYSQTASETINSHEDLVGNISENTIPDYAFVGPIRDLDAGDRPEPHKESGNDCSGDSSSGSEPAECERDRECETDRECEKKRECETDQEYETYQEYETGQKCETDQESWERRFWQHRVVCIDCWLSFKRGLRNPRSTVQNDSSGEDDDSEEEFSPYLFNI